MKQIIFIALLIGNFLVVNSNVSYGFCLPKPIKTDNKYFTVNSLNVNSIINLSAKQFSELTGKKMNVWDKLAFRVMKTKMKHDLKKNPNLTLDKYYAKDGKKRLGTGWWILIGVVGLILLVGVIFVISYGGNGD